MATALPVATAGLAVGGAAVDDREAVAQESPWPGLPGAPRVLAWSDSVGVVALPDPGNAPFATPLVALRSVVVARAATRARAIATFEQGSDAWEDDALAVERGDSLNGFRVEVETGNRGVTGSWGDGSRRLWDGALRLARGAHQVRVAYGQDGASGHFPLGIGQSAEGESGRADWRWIHRGFWTDVGVARGDDHHVSLGDTLAWSRRDAGRTHGEVEIGGEMAGGTTRARLALEEANVRRTFADSAAFDRDAHSAWVALSHERRLGAGRVEGSLGVARHDAAGGTRMAPWVAWQASAAGGTTRLAAGRWLVPLWSDLAPGQAPFVQSTWAACAQWSADRPAWHGDLLLLGGRARQPALVARLPLEELGLRRGVLAGDPLHFALAAGGASVKRGAWSGGVGGFGLARDGEVRAEVDPAWAARAFAGWSGTLFQGDLGIHLRVFGDALGRRAIDAPGAGEIPAFATLGASAALTLADATIVLEGANLEDRVRPEPWLDPATGAAARGGGMQLRLALRLKLYN